MASVAASKTCAPVPDVPQTLTLLRASLMKGRGAGSAPGEVLAYTRERSMLGAVPAALEREHVADAAARARLGLKPARHGRSRARDHRPHARRNSVLCGAALALLARALLDRITRTPRIRGL